MIHLPLSLRETMSSVWGEGHVTLKAFTPGLESYFLPVIGSGFWFNALRLCASSG